jgi:hypothetical protein
MNVRLYNDDALKTLTPTGQIWSDIVQNYLMGLVGKAVIEGVSPQDLKTMVCEEINILTIQS